MSDPTLVIGLLGAKALWATYVWLLGAIAASWLSHRKGYGEKPGLATGLLVPILGPLVWLLWPARDASRWRTQGALPRPSRGTKERASAGSAGARDEGDAG
jgi:hypothetical protein